MRLGFWKSSWVRGKKEDKKILTNIWGSDYKIDYYGEELDFKRIKVIMYAQSLYVGFAKKLTLNIKKRRISMKEPLLDKRLQQMVEDYVPSGEILDELVCFFSIFSDYTRLKMISALAISEMCVSDIASLLKLNQTTVSHQLRLLKNMNAVKTKRQGKVIFYSLRNETLSDVLLKGVEFLGY